MNPVGVYVKLGKKIPTNVTVSGMIDDEEEDKTKKEKERLEPKFRNTIMPGTNLQQKKSLNKIKNLPGETKIYCGHEYTLNNAKFCKKYDSENKDLQKKIEKIEKLRENGIPTIPSTLKEELDCNIFLRAKDVKTFSKLRDFKDNF